MKTSNNLNNLFVNFLIYAKPIADNEASKITVYDRDIKECNVYYTEKDLNILSRISNKVFIELIKLSEITDPDMIELMYVTMWENGPFDVQSIDWTVHKAIESIEWYFIKNDMFDSLNKAERIIEDRKRNNNGN